MYKMQYEKTVATKYTINPLKQKYSGENNIHKSCEKSTTADMKSKQPNSGVCLKDFSHGRRYFHH